MAKYTDNFDDIGFDQSSSYDNFNYSELPSSSTWGDMQGDSFDNEYYTEEQFTTFGGAQPPTRPEVPVSGAVFPLILFACVYALLIVKRIMRKKFI